MPFAAAILSLRRKYIYFPDERGDCLGAVALLSQEEGAKMESSAVKLARLTADIIANQFES